MTRSLWIADRDALATRASAWRTANAVGLDTEFTRISTFWPELALLQISAHDEVEIVDPLAFDAAPVLGPLLADAVVVKIIHSASEDIVALAPLCGGAIAGLFDTQIAAAFAGLGAGLGYRKLVEVLVGVTLPKDETRSDWRRRPLSAQQLAYAEADVVHLPRIHAMLVERLRARGTLDWCLEDCARLASGAASLDALPRNAHWEIKSAARWPAERQARLKRLLDWRERLARRIDKPRQWIFDNEAAVSLSALPPPDPDAVTKLIASQKSFPKSERAAFAQWVGDPLTAEELAIEPIPPAFEGELKRRAEALRLAVEQRAAALDVPASVLAPRRIIEALVRGEEPAELGGWRGAELRALV